MNYFSIGSSVLYLESCANSMDAAKEHLVQLQHGTILSIKQLAAARGRQGRVWSLAPGQLVMTLVLKPEQALVDRPDALHFLFMAISLGICAPLKKYGVGLKWPNDLYLDGKKLAGILMESVWQDSKLQGLVLGFAINVNNQFSSDHELFGKAISLRDVVEHEFDLQQLEQEILQSLNQFYDLWVIGDFVELFEVWREAQILKGQNITVHQSNGSLVQGVMHDVFVNGDMVLLNEENKDFLVSFSQVAAVFINS